MGKPKNKFFEHPDDFKFAKMLIYNFSKFYKIYHSSDKSLAAKANYFLKSCLPYDVGLEIGFPPSTLRKKVHSYQGRKYKTNSKSPGKLIGLYREISQVYHGSRFSKYYDEVTTYLLLESSLISQAFKQDLRNLEDGLLGYSQYSTRGERKVKKIKKLQRVHFKKQKSILHLASNNDSFESEIKIRFNTKNIFALTFINDLYRNLLKQFPVIPSLKKSVHGNTTRQNALHIRIDCSKFVNPKRLTNMSSIERIIEFTRIAQSLILCESFFVDINFYTGQTILDTFRFSDNSNNFSPEQFQFGYMFDKRLTYRLEGMSNEYGNPKLKKASFEENEYEDKLSSKSQGIEFRMQNNVMSFQYVMLRIFLYSYFVYLLESTTEIVSPEKLKVFWEKLQK